MSKMLTLHHDTYIERAKEQSDFVGETLLAKRIWDESGYYKGDWVGNGI